MFRLEMDTDNYAFHEGETHGTFADMECETQEIARILRQVADDVERAGAEGNYFRKCSLIDYNGNKVGKCWTTRGSSKKY